MDLNTLWQIPPWDWPTDAGAMLLRTLRDARADRAERLRAVKLAGVSTVLDDELARALLAIARSPDETDHLRAAAAVSLGPVLADMDMDDAYDPEDRLVSGDVAREVRDGLARLYGDPGLPKEVRRRVLEASVRAVQPWHAAAVREAYASGDPSWKLTAVFCMRYVGGFDKEIVEALETGDAALRYEAVQAAGDCEVDAAWPHVRALVEAGHTEKSLLLAAIHASVHIRPEEAVDILADLADSDDDEIEEAVLEALALAEAVLGLEDWDSDELDEEVGELGPHGNGSGRASPGD